MTILASGSGYHVARNIRFGLVGRIGISFLILVEFVNCRSCHHFAKARKSVLHSWECDLQSGRPQWARSGLRDWAGQQLPYWQSFNNDLYTVQSTIDNRKVPSRNNQKRRKSKRLRLETYSGRSNKSTAPHPLEGACDRRAWCIDHQNKSTQPMDVTQAQFKNLRVSSTHVASQDSQDSLAPGSSEADGAREWRVNRNQVSPPASPNAILWPPLSPACPLIPCTTGLSKRL